ncbi:single-stranded-DNA-specific exonuclease RecJ [Trichlorobacter ammonificans]|uniref:Single-stranded-DNA-specific exonuclease RecJ n=1 Tax=Trichlorobacter ammonificans TaxID=2916410 RepID=A0ABN8HFP4_9BACT|nr:single-stranded-DNA-specific exonuclease RecJ [Trichlorobacter ammonificans]CAH2031659.1 Single-stranded-DNA-specific exonuclease recJ [Trichlorobacter ammonificans]
MNRHWRLTPYDPAAASRLTRELGLSPVIARILASRGFTTPAAADGFLSPTLAGMTDPGRMAGMEQAVDRLLLARERQEPVCIYGDYDVDGISATALLVSALPVLGIRADYHIPHRMEDGYGLSLDALRQLADQGYRLIISVDCGITALEEARFCRVQGLDLIITDHHQPLEELPDAVAVLNPQRSDCPYPFKGLAGVGVAFCLLVALRSRLREQGLLDGGGPDLRQWLDLVALGTIADMVPLTGQNRLLVSAGLQRMGNGCRTGLAALKAVATVKGAVSCGQVGFRLAPRLNAAGRLESALPGVELLLTDDPARAQLLARELDAANSERQQVERRIFEEAEALMALQGWNEQHASIVLSSPLWHPGVVGIVASRLTERHARPAILLARRDDGSGKGSGRGIARFHLLEALHACAAHLERYGGHRAAAGLTVAPGELDAFATTFERVAAAQLAATDLAPTLSLDAELTPEELNLSLVGELARLAPFGIGNAEPTLLLRGMRVLEARTVGDGHLKMRLEKERTIYPAIGWRMAGGPIPQRVDIACTPELDTWGGGERLQLRLKGIRPEELHGA